MKLANILLALLLVMPLVLASSTPISVKTLPEHNVTIIIVKVDDNNPLKTYEVISDTTGQVNLIHESDYSSSIYLSIASRKDGKLSPYNETMPIFKSANFYPGNSISIDFIRTPVQALTNTSVVNNTSQQNTTQTTQQQTNQTPQTEIQQTATGSSIKRLIEKIPFKTIGIYAAYILLGIIALGIIVFFVIKVAMPFIQSNPLKRAELSGYYSANDIRDKKVEKELEKAEAKLKEAQVEIDKIRNKRNAVKEAELRFEQAKKELEKLKGTS